MSRRAGWSRILVAGGAGFIGSHFARIVLAERPATEVVIYDKLTYAGNPENFADLETDPRFSFVLGDIADAQTLTDVMRDCDAVVNFAAETHVDRSIVNPEAFLDTDIIGTFRLMTVARELNVSKVVQVSTDEVYGSLQSGFATEDAKLEPSSPYAASKASGDLLALAFHTTYGLPVCVTRGSNTYGPNQYPEKLIPLFVTNALEGKTLPLYGDGLQRRDWLHVTDHARGILKVLDIGAPGSIYNLGGGNERTNREITETILRVLSLSPAVVQHVEDRPGHDRRYAVDSSRVRQLGWEPLVGFNEGLESTIVWYRDNGQWWKRIKQGDAFGDWHALWYSDRRKHLEEPR